MSEKTIENLVKELVSYVNTCIDEFNKSHPLTQEETTYKEKYEYIVSELIYLKEQAQNLYDNMKEEGLTVGLVEAEGYLRAFKTIEGNGLLGEIKTSLED